MRLADREIAAIRACAEKNFAPGSHVWLFGSRTDDTRRGGDIDLYIESSDADAGRVVDARLRFLMELHSALGDQRIDVVVRRAGTRTRLPVYDVARETGVQLL